MSDQAVPLSKRSPNWRIILVKGQFDHSYTFWTMPILIFNPGANFGHHSLHTLHIFSNQIKRNLTQQKCYNIYSQTITIYQNVFHQAFVCFHYKLGLDEEERVSRVKVIFLLCTKSIKLLLSGKEGLREKQINPKYQHSKLQVVFIW